MSKTAKRHTACYVIQDKYGCTPYIFKWSGKRDRFSEQEITRIAERRHAQRRAQKYQARQEEVVVEMGNSDLWTTIGKVLWWIGTYTLVIIKFSFQLVWKAIVVFFALFIGQLLLGMFLTRR